MGLLGRLRKKDVPERVDIGISRQEIKNNFKLIERYTVSNPHAQILIFEDPGIGVGLRYFIDEIDLNEEELIAYDKLMKIISKELEPPIDLDVDPETHFRAQSEIISKKYKRSLQKIDDEGWKKILYYLVRDMVGYGALDPIMKDPNIEDISCNGLYRPIYVWHRKYESIPANIGFNDERTINDFIIKLAHKGSKHISSAHPILDATLPEKHRMAATFQKEVSTLGSSFCIRKFREDPLSVVDLTRFGTLSPKLAAYFWILLESRMSFMSIGGTGAGKTSLVNALLSMIPPNEKIVTIEEVAELRPPHENWVPLISRKGFSFGSGGGGSIDLFDLIKVSLRYRPDYIVVGEIRGSEAFTLFQAIATGHGGICTMHADSLDHAVKRLNSEPMNIAKVYISLMSLAMYISRVELPEQSMGLKFGRRIRDVWEIKDFDKYVKISSWDPINDTFDVNLKKSVKLKEISERKGVSFQSILEEVELRTKLIKNMSKINARSQGEVVHRLQEYVKTGEYGLFRNGIPDPRLVEDSIRIRGKSYKIWRYPKDALDIDTGRKIGGRIVKRGKKQ